MGVFVKLPSLDFEEFNIGSVSSSEIINFSNSPSQTVTLTANTAFNLINAESGKAYILKVQQDNTGGYTATFSGVLWPGGTAPTITTDPDAVDLINFYCDSDGTLYGSFAQDYS